MKSPSIDKIRAAEIELPCAALGPALEFFADRLGFRLALIFPADAPRVAVVEGYGLRLRLVEAAEKMPATLNLYGAFAGEERELVSPDGVRVRLCEADAALAIPPAAHEFVVTPAPAGDGEEEGAWNAGRAGMLYRDLLPTRLGGRFVASHIRIPTGGPVPDYVHYHRIRFQMIYCLAGRARLVYEDQGAPFWMAAGDCVLQPPGIRHRVLECSDAFEVLEIGCPAVHETLVEREMDLPNGPAAPGKSYGGQFFVHHRAHAAARRLRPDGFEERDTGIRAATGGLADVTVLGAPRAARMNARHAGEFLFFFVAAGALRIAAANGAQRLLAAGAACALPPETDFVIDAAPGLEAVRIAL